MRRAGTIPAVAAGVTGRFVVGPLPPDSVVRGVTLIGSKSGVADTLFQASIATFRNRPADTEAAFTNGDDLVGPGSTLANNPALSLPFDQCCYIPLNYQVKQALFVGVQAATVADTLSLTVAFDVVPPVSR